MKTYKKLPRSFWMKLLSFAPKHTQMYMLVDNFHEVWSDNVYVYIVKDQHVLSVQFFTRPIDQSFRPLMAYIYIDRFPFGIQEFLNNLLTK